MTSDAQGDHPGAIEAAQAADAAEVAVQGLCRATLNRPSLTPADVDVVLASLSCAVAALPQACAQLAEILDEAKRSQVLEIDSMVETNDPALVIDTARLHLDAAREAAQALYRLLAAAHNQTAHIISHASL